MEFVTHSEEETKNFGSQLAHDLHGGDVVCLYGELGAGKTTLVKGIAEGLEIKEEMTSPTFTLMNVYKNNQLTLVHIDTYRLKDEHELIEIGATDYLGKPNIICIIEWPDKLPTLLKDKKITKIEIEHLNEQERKISVI